MYYLQHYFNPDFSHLKLSPHELVDKIEYRYLGYVQNVVKGQVLAEMLLLEECPETKRDPRFIYSSGQLPCGPNCGIHPEDPRKLVALSNGFVFYHNGLITVKKLLNIRGNLGFHTGNVFFVGDVAVHGDVQTNFALKAKNILVKGHIESAKVQALNDLVCLSGVKGANLSNLNQEAENTDDSFPIPSTLVTAGKNMRLPFCEHVQLRAKGNLIIDGSCLHSTLYVGGNLIVKGRLQGGAVYANGSVYVQEQLGSDYGSLTRIMMGYDPFDFLLLQKLESQISYLTSKLGYFQKLVARNKVMAQEHGPRLELVTRKLGIAYSKRRKLWKKFSVDEQHAPQCKIIVPGKIMPGCEIGIGRSFLAVDTTLRNTTFTLQDTEVIAVSPAFACVDKRAGRSSKGGKNA